MAQAWRMLRFRAGRWLMTLGLNVLPQSRARSELYQMIDIWATDVRRAVRASQVQS